MKTKWTKELVRLEALNHSTRNGFRVSCSGAYKAANRLNILHEVCSHMPSDAKVGGHSHNYKWTPDTIRMEASKYKTKGQFSTKSSSAYSASIRLGMLEELNSSLFVSGLRGDKNPNYRWTHDMLVAESRKYETAGEFQKHSKGAYLSAYRRGVLKDISLHLKKSIKESKGEINLRNEIAKRFPKAQKLCDRKVNIDGKPHIQGFDIDIYIPELRKGIEFDGKYWHSIDGLKRSRIDWPEEDLENYHKIKDEHFKSKGIEILHVKEADWIANKESCIKECLEFLG